MCGDDGAVIIPTKMWILNCVFVEVVITGDEDPA